MSDLVPTLRPRGGVGVPERSHVGSPAPLASGTGHTGHVPLLIEEDASNLTSWFRVSSGSRMTLFIGRLTIAGR